MRDFDETAEAAAPAQSTALLRPLTKPIRAYPPCERPARIPLSGAQTIFFPERAELAPSFRVPWFWRVRGELDRETLEYAFSQFVARHEVLRTRFLSDGDQAWQEVLEPRPVVVQWLEAPGASIAEREEAARQLVTPLWETDAVDFDGMNLKIRVCRIGPDDHILYLWLNHVAADGSCMGLIRRDLFELYAAKASGRAPDLPLLKYQYADYALWEADFSLELGSGAGAGVKDAPPIRIGEEDLNEAERTAENAAISFVDAATTARIRALARQYAVTPSVILLTLVGKALSREAKQSRGAVSCVCSLRPPSATDLMGCFMRVRPLVLDFTDEAPLEVAFSRMKQAYAKVLDRRVQPDPDYTKALPVMINLQRRAMSCSQVKPTGWGATYQQELNALSPDATWRTPELDLVIDIVEFEDSTTLTASGLRVRHADAILADFERSLAAVTGSSTRNRGVTLILDASGRVLEGTAEVALNP